MIADAPSWTLGQWLVVNTSPITWASIPAPVEVVFICLLVLAVTGFLGLFERPARPEIVHSHSDFAKKLVNLCPVLSERFVPVWLWGRSRHFVCVTFGQIDRFFCKSLEFTIRTVVAEDGGLATYGFFQKETDEQLSSVGEENVPVVLVVPGINNNSSHKYIHSLAGHLFSELPHFRIAVLNHTGTMENTKLAVPRIFSYGCTLDFSAMVEDVRHRYPQSPLLAVGLSMGGNVVLNYFGRAPHRQESFLAVVSCCQGYDMIAAQKTLLVGSARLYNYLLTKKLRRIITSLSTQLFVSAQARFEAAHNKERAHNVSSAHVQKERQLVAGCCSSIPLPDEEKVLLANKLQTIDEYFFRRVAGYDDVQEFYRAESSATHLNKITKLPVLLLNAEDDPLVSPSLLHHAHAHAEQNPHSLFVKTRHGSHLGFYEGGLLIPNRWTWMDRCLTQYIKAILALHNKTILANGDK